MLDTQVTTRYSYFALWVLKSHTCIEALIVPRICYRDIGEFVNDEAPFSAVFTFSGNKIKVIDAVNDAAAIARYLSHLT